MTSFVCKTVSLSGMERPMTDLWGVTMGKCGLLVWSLTIFSTRMKNIDFYIESFLQKQKDLIDCKSIFMSTLKIKRNI